MIRIVMALALFAAAGAQEADSPVGRYDGSRHELAAGLELTADGRFAYAASMGGLDEVADGRWRVADGRVLLTSDPVTPPEIALVERSAGPRGRLQVALDTPQGGDPGFFDLRLDGNTPALVQMGEQGRDIPLTARAPLRVTMVLPIYGVESAPVTVDPAAGARLRFRFTPNDIDKLPLSDAELKRDGDDYVLDRLGQPLRFRRVK